MFAGDCPSEWPCSRVTSVGTWAWASGEAPFPLLVGYLMTTEFSSKPAKHYFKVLGNMTQGVSLFFQGRNGYSGFLQEEMQLSSERPPASRPLGHPPV